MIAIIDYGAGNIKSVYKALRHIGCDVEITRDRAEIARADGAVLPGVGAFGDTVDTMERYGIKDSVIEYIKSGKPFLGICLGLQLLFPESEESPGKKGLSLFDGEIKRIPSGEGLKIPHIGWNSIDILKKDGIFRGVENGSFFYFVHSYYLKAGDPKAVAAQTRYGVKIDAAIEVGNAAATQFHPEKSGDAGIKILKNFADSVAEGKRKDAKICTPKE